MMFMCGPVFCAGTADKDYRNEVTLAKAIDPS